MILEIFEHDNKAWVIARQKSDTIVDLRRMEHDIVAGMDKLEVDNGMMEDDPEYQELLDQYQRVKSLIALLDLAEKGMNERKPKKFAEVPD